MSVELKDHSAEAIAAKNAAVLRFLEEAGLHLEGEAKEALEMSPRRIDTGLLRNSITHALDGEGAAISSYSSDDGTKTGAYGGKTPEERPGHDAVYVGTNVEYAPYVHEGTMKMEPNRFIKNAFEANADQLREKLKKELKGE